METHFLFPHHAQYHLSIGIMKQVYFFVSILFLSLVTGCIEQAVEQESVVHLIVTGKIEDPTGNPVEGIEVTITGQNLCLPRPFEVEALGAVYTDVNGSYYFEVVTHPWSNIQLTTRDIDGPAHGGLFADNGALASPDYRGARLKADDSTWDFGTARLEFPVMTLRYAE